MPGRDNGFVARHYVALADLDPRLADAMLDVLRAESIAAYVEPSTGHLGGYLEVHLPERPHDRLWVDRERHDRAVMLLNEHTAGAAPAPSDQRSDRPSGQQPERLSDQLPVDVDQPTIDDAWAQLVANYDVTSDDEIARWPASEDLASAPGQPPDGDGVGDSHRIDGQQTLPLDGLIAPDTTPPSPVPRRIVRPADRNAGAPLPPNSAQPAGAAGISGEYDPLSALDEHFVPPTPPRPPALRPITRWAIVAIVAGFALIIVKTFSDNVPGGVTLGILGIVGGFGTLVFGMRPDRSDDSDSDDGAVV